MTSRVEALSRSRRDLYRFKLDLNMAGGWRLSVDARVPGEEEAAKARSSSRSPTDVILTASPAPSTLRSRARGLSIDTGLVTMSLRDA